jgi:hypothetical protein
VLIAVCVLAAAALIALRSPRVRLAAAGVALAALLLAPSVWAFDTLGHATSGTFPEGGPGNVQTLGGGMFAGPGGFGARGGSAPRALGAARSAGGGVPLFGTGRPPSGETGSGAATTQGLSSAQSGGVPGAGQVGGPLVHPPTGAASGNSGGGAPMGFGGGGTARAGGFGAGAFGGPTGNDPTTTQALAYVKAHGGGTIAVSSQSSAATAIVASGAKIAGIGGFSGRESDVSVSWLAGKVRTGSIRWVLVEQAGARSGGGGGGLPGDTRAGSKAAMTAVAKTCRKVALMTSSASTALGARTAGGSSSASALYDCRGRAGALASS